MVVLTKSPQRNYANPIASDASLRFPIRPRIVPRRGFLGIAVNVQFMRLGQPILSLLESFYVIEQFFEFAGRESNDGVGASIVHIEVLIHNSTATCGLALPYWKRKGQAHATENGIMIMAIAKDRIQKRITIHSSLARRSKSDSSSNGQSICQITISGRKYQMG